MNFFSRGSTDVPRAFPTTYPDPSYAFSRARKKRKKVRAKWSGTLWEHPCHPGKKCKQHHNTPEILGCYGCSQNAPNHFSRTLQRTTPTGQSLDHHRRDHAKSTCPAPPRESGTPSNHATNVETAGNKKLEDENWLSDAGKTSLERENWLSDTGKNIAWAGKLAE